MSSTHQHTSSVLDSVADVAPRRSLGTIWRPSMMQLTVDVLAFMVSFAVYQAVRPLILTDVRLFSLGDHAVIAAVSCAFWCIAFWMGGLYRDYYIRSPFEEFFALFRVTFLGSVTIFLLIFFGSSEDFRSNPRFVFVIYWFVLFGLTAIGRMVARQLQRRFRERGIITIPTVLIGTRERLAELLADLRDEPAWGYDVLGVVEVGSANGAIDDVPTVVRALRPREVLVTMDHTDHDALLKVTAQAADEGALVRIVPDLYEIFSGQARTQQIYGSPLIEVSPELMQPWEEVAKRTMDIVVSLLILVVGLPVWVLTALAVKLTSAGPMFFIQDRVGKNGSVFRMAKFRSMYTDDRRGPTWTDENDPRVTPVGRFIRKTHLDEIPQLWNVLKGEMSLVGPRPEQPHYVEKFTQMLPYYRRRHKVRPGVTGWWQVKVKSNPESLEEIKNRLRYDFFYIENMSFKLDLEIMVRTVFVMLRGHGRA